MDEYKVAADGNSSLVRVPKDSWERELIQEDWYMVEFLRPSKSCRKQYRSYLLPLTSSMPMSRREEISCLFVFIKPFSPHLCTTLAPLYCGALFTTTMVIQPYAFDFTILFNSWRLGRINLGRIFCCYSTLIIIVI